MKRTFKTGVTRDRNGWIATIVKGIKCIRINRITYEKDAIGLVEAFREALQ